jgi:aquaporin Z
VLGAILGSGVLYLIASGKAGFDLQAGFASNGYGEHSPGKYGLGSALVCEVVMTFMFLAVILGATHRRAPTLFAGIAIGLCLTLIHLVSIPVTNTSVNPARSTGPALFVGGWALEQLWLFWVALIVGAMLAGGLSHVFHGDSSTADRRDLIRAPRSKRPPSRQGTASSRSISTTEGWMRGRDALALSVLLRRSRSVT